MTVINQNPAPISKLLVSVDETRAITGLGRTTIYELLNSGVLKSVKIGKRRLVVVESIQALTQTDGAD